MSDSGGGVLRAFLVRLGYKVDESGQRRFDEGLAAGTARAAALHSAVGDIGRQLGLLGEGLRAAGEKLERLGDPIERTRRRGDLLNRELKFLGLAAAGTTTAFVTGFTEIARQYDNLYYVAQRTGASAQQLAGLQFAGPQIGLSAQDMTAAAEALATAARHPGLKALLDSWGVASNDINGFEQHLRGLPPFLQDIYSQMFGVSTTFTRNWQNNWQVVAAAQEQFASRAREAGLDYKQVTEEGVSVTRDLNTIWSQLGITAAKGFTEAFPYMDKALKYVIAILDKTNEWNASHPGAAMAENLAAALVSATGLLAILGKLTGLFSVGGIAGGAARVAGAGAVAAVAPVAAGAYAYRPYTLNAGEDAAVRAGLKAPTQAEADEATRRSASQQQREATETSGFWNAVASPFRNWWKEGTAPGPRGDIPRYQGGGLVTHDQLALLHGPEMVLPPDLSRGFQQIIATMQGGQGQMVSAGGKTADDLSAWLSGSSAFLPYVRIVGWDQVTGATTSSVAPSETDHGGGISSGQRRGRWDVAGSAHGAAGAHGEGGGIEGLKPTTGGRDESVIRDTIRQAGEKLNLTPQQIHMAQAGFLSAFSFESNLRHDIVRPGGHDTGWAQWVGPRLRHMATYGDPRSIEANQKQLFYELTGPYRESFLRAAKASTPREAGLAAHYFESGGAPQFEGKVKQGHLAQAENFYRQSEAASSSDAAGVSRVGLAARDWAKAHHMTHEAYQRAMTYLVPPGTPFNSRGIPYNVNMSAAEQRGQDASYRNLREHPRSWLDRGQKPQDEKRSDVQDRILGKVASLGDATLGTSSTINNDAGDRSFEMHQTNHITMAPGDDAGRVMGPLNEHAGTLLRNARSLMN